MQPEVHRCTLCDDAAGPCTAFYPSDLVCLHSDSSVGAVTRVPEISDDEEDELGELGEDDSENGEVGPASREPLEAGFAEIAWKRGGKQVIDDGSIILLDRVLCTSDVVTLARHRTHQMGTVTATHIFVDLLRAETLEPLHQHVPQASVFDLHRFRADVSVVLKTQSIQWLGTVFAVLLELKLQFSDGVQCSVSTDDPWCPEANTGSEDFPYYPSMTVRTSHSLWSRAHSAVTRRQQRSQVEHDYVAVVVDVNVRSVRVSWSCNSKNDADATPPSENMSPNDLTIVKSIDSLLSVGDPVKHIATGLCCIVCRTTTYVDVQWQDGSHSYNVKSTQLFPSHRIGEIDFCPGDYVLRKDLDKKMSTRSSNGSNVNSSEDVSAVGSVVAVSADHRLCRVLWLESQSVEQLSVYELVDHPSYTFRLGDEVLRRQQPVPSAGPWVGIIVGHSKGLIEVEFTDATRELCHPSDIVRAETVDAEKDESEDGEEESSEDGDQEVDEDDAGWETDSDASESHNEDHSITNSNSEHSSDEDDLDHGGPLQTNRRNFLLEDDLIDSDDDEEMYWEEWEHSARLLKVNQVIEDEARWHRQRLVEASDVSKHSIVCKQVSLSVDDPASQAAGEPRDTNDDSHNIDLGSLQLSTSLAEPISLCVCNFALVQGIDDHAFDLEYSEQHDRRGFTKVVASEWDALRNGLPPDIYVRGYSDRNDLLRVVIIGPSDTPYENGVFVFDVQLPYKYPREPPLVKYVSRTEQLHPNLGDDGEVSLDLLGTGPEESDEAWDKGQSSLLQLFISLQRQTFVRHPFIETTSEQQHSATETYLQSRYQNERVILLSLESLCALAMSPPLHTESIIDFHLQSKHSQMLARCDMLLSRTPWNEVIDEYSEGFVVMLQKLRDRLATISLSRGPLTRRT